ncbi:major facilitator superfamily domain-containing protein [Bombardia bombarda]|uniref:Major facilitator superfamily domain-containing protein n=1 Tax=Bombardia bombarda TaxID=252184 RepID=A0AA40CA47_9PEZI|nr:major facilitator superfamily domain-containing protein [Bombardia bombarda]
MVSPASQHLDQITEADTKQPAEVPQDHDVEKTPIPAAAQQQSTLPPPPLSSEEDLYQPRSFRFWMTLVCNFLALFLVALDRTIIATAVPRISDEFGSLGDIGWYGSAYMLTTSCAQLVYGRIYKFYDMKWTFLVSIVVFEIGSAICGAAPTSTVFILGRAIAGLASAGIFSGSMLIMIPMVPLHRRPAFQGLFGMVFGIASVMGPLIGGGFTSGATWRWCFYINLPIGAVSMVFLVLFWNPPKEKRHEPISFMAHVKRLDPIGMVFFLPGTVCLLLALQWGGSTFAWSEWRIILLFVIFGVCLAAFIASQILRPDTAMVPPRVIKQRSVAFGTSFTFFLSGSMLMLVYYVPIWCKSRCYGLFQTVKQVEPIKSGIYTLPLVLSLVISSIMSGIGTGKIGYYVPSMLLAPSIMSIGEGLMSTFNRDTPTSHWIAFQFLAGFGLGFGMQTSGLAIQTVLPKEDMSAGIAVNFFVQQLGGAVFTSVGQTILSNLLVSRLSGIPGFHPGAVVNEGATDLEKAVPPEYVDQVIDGYNYACQRIFLTAMGLAFASLICAFGMEWRSVKKGRNGQGPPAPAVTPAPPSPAPSLGFGRPGRPFFDVGADEETAQTNSKQANTYRHREDKKPVRTESRHSTISIKPAPGWGTLSNRSSYQPEYGLQIDDKRGSMLTPLVAGISSSSSVHEEKKGMTTTATGSTLGA